MKIVLLKKQKLGYIFIFIFLLFVGSFFFFDYSYSFAIKLSKSSFFSDDIVGSLDEIAKSNDKKAYLTFDDGPTLKCTEKVLDILKEENVKATFFVVGKHVKEYPEIVKREYEEGHYIANHGYNHNNKLLYRDMESFKKEITDTDLEIAKAIGVENYSSHIFRFPNRLYVSYLF